MGDVGYMHSYYEAPRYLIFEREAPRVISFDDFKSLMTFNSWKRDLYSRKDPSQSILSRYDLRTGDDPRLPAKAFGGLDSKCTRYTEYQTRMHVHAIAGPKHDDINPVWEFGKGRFASVLYDGLPQKWDFNRTTFSAKGIDTCKEAQNEDSCIELPLCGWCISSQEYMPGDSFSPFFEAKCESGRKAKTYIQPWATTVIVTTSSIILLLVISIYTQHFLNKP